MQAFKTDANGQSQLKGKRILFFCVRFFGYEQEIIAELRRRGATVDHLQDRPFETPFMKAVTRFSRTAMMPAADRFYRRKLAGFDQAPYDYIFVVNGQTLPRGLIQDLRRLHPDARYVLYMWDSIRNRPNAPEIMPFFDECITFEPEAARAYGMRLRPLFFTPGFQDAAAPVSSYDLSFIGTAHSDRYQIITALDAKLPNDVRRFWYLYLQARWVFHTYRMFKRGFRLARMSQFRFDPMPRLELQRIFRETCAVIDIEHPQQTGLTMRTFEAIGARKKLITTNAGIREYPFYNPSNIHVIDREDPTLPEDFLNTEYQELAPELYYNLSLAGWVDDILEHHHVR